MNRTAWVLAVLVPVALLAFVATVVIVKWGDFPEEPETPATTESTVTHDEHASGDQPSVPTPTIAQAHSSDEHLPPEVSCPEGVSKPTMKYGTYCGPPPVAGNGLGKDGLCTGVELVPPCGPGVQRGEYYAYTMPGSCAGVMEFDNQLWLSRLPPPTEVPPMYVWMGYDEATGNPHLIGPGMVSFVKDDGSRAPCRGGPAK